MREVCPLVPEVIERQCHRTPEAVAVVCEGDALTYRELDARAARIARVLRGRGVGPESRVALRLDRSVDAVAAMLGVWKAGGAYVPLDRAYPRERLDFMIADSGAAVVIDEAFLALARDASPLPAVEIHPLSLAYVIYTSGSTGRPKGVLVPHVSLANYTAALVRRMDLPEGTQYANVSTFAADLGHTVIFPSLATGGTLHVVPSHAATDADAFTAADCLKIVPSHLEALLDTAGDPARVLPRRLLVVGGEATRPALVQRVRALAPSLRILNHYGPTETTVGVLTHDVTGADVPLGFPIDNAAAYVVEGELYIGGAPVARGYHERPDLTAERFVPDPFSSLPGARMYRTGDLVRTRPDGALEFLGRADSQVKIRGHRVELREIEAALGGAAVAIVRGGRLLAYVLGDADPAALKAALRLTLPEHMIPAAIVPVNAFPLTANGKLDRDALPDPPRTAATYANGTERTLAELFEPLLGVAPAADESLLDLGAHSLVLMRAAARIRAAFGVSVDMAALFGAPTLAAIAARIEAASPAEPLPHAAGEPVLSLGQQRMWIVRQLAAEPALYNIPAVMRTRATAAELERALSALVERHEALRTVVRPDGTAFLAPRAPVSVRTVEAEDALAAAREGVRRPFDLGTAPLLRALLVNGELLVLTVHHIASDGWSTRILLRELDALLRGEELPPLGARYADFAAWQRRWLDSAGHDASLAYWRGQLAGLEGTLALPLDRPRPAVESGRGTVHRFALDPALLARAGAFARASGATPFMVLLAAFQLLLRRITGQADVAVGSPLAGRDFEELDQTVGFFVNTIVLRARVEGGESFRSLVARVRDVCLGAYAHGSMPFDRIVEALRPRRDLGAHPLFQTMFAVQEPPLPGQVDVPTGAAKVDLTLELEGDGGKLTYAADLFDAATIERLADHYIEMLGRALDTPETSVALLPLHVEDFNPAPSDYPRAALAELFAAQAARTPDAVAVEDGETFVTYAELDARADAVAEELRGRGVGCGSLVGIRMERSIELIAGIVGIVKAGAAYVPLDGSYPEERIQFMIEDAGLEAVLEGDGRIRDRRRPAGCPAGVPPAGSLAYVVYTSGSTGQPKGVAIPQSAVVRLVFNTNYFPFSQDERIAQISNSSFDAATFEVWGALLHGGTLVILPRETTLSTPLFAMALRERNITALFITTALFNQHVRERADVFATVRHVLFGGEACDVKAIASCLAGGPPGRLLHVYGPTESTTFASWHLVESAGGTTVPIGKALSNTTLHVLDAAMQRVPVGVAGELFIGGDGLALGYHGRPELTAERFVPDPFGAGSRLYRTGDLVRQLPGGAIEFLGRLDDQVKIRGFRIEPGEIESVLRSITGVADACVVVREHEGDRRLVAYVVGCLDGLRSILRTRLPEYMVPSAFVAVDALPLNANGKVDRRALPEPRFEAPAAQVATDTERALAQIWSEVLAADAGVRDNFFEIGGHSLLAVRVMSRIRVRFDVELPLSAIFERPTIASLAACIEDERGVLEEVEL